MQEPQAFIAEDCPTSFFDSYDIPGVHDDFLPLLEAICYPLVFLTRVIPSTISIPHHIVKRMQRTLRKKGSCHATIGGIGEVNTNLDSPLVIVGMMTSPPMAILQITTGMAVDCTAEKNAFKVKNRETYILAIMKVKKPSFRIMIIGLATSPGLMRGRKIPITMTSMSPDMHIATARMRWAASVKVSSVTCLA